MIIAVTPYELLTDQHIQRLNMIEPQIDGVLLRTPMTQLSLIEWLHALLQDEFPKSKVIIHTDITLAKRMGIQRLHFKEGDKQAFHLKETHPSYSVSMSVHHVESIIKAREHQLDFGLFGHVFPSASKQGKPPRTNAEVCAALSEQFPLIAIGGIDQHTVTQVNPKFIGMACIRSAFNIPIQVFDEMVQKWKMNKER
ncbi:thiamine phosphate synthase [Staphylococcus muscae]|uniref:Thiamine monophosphate synthase n=1 Tax=Staphylococcus muscae TaxID=1294 RepID=A0A240BXY1_9STAP|nr:thiamine phosphate synthase [Staphylococcus muscae]AVQ34251.1 thiamine phosphate synthase [Staphylococcus muscae]PNZ03898.1 thiamine phosphate synthase [Staphylococcus muscae]GGA84816.1 thiamine phosphate synthase [Staphylococcus muscae]SNV99718.1 thiamine monophosphate synthase [Staphylococcus muscae]